MFKQLVTRLVPGSKKAAAPTNGSGLARIRSAYGEWRISQDIGAIMAVLDRLSDRRLAMIGVHRDGLYDAVADMMERAQERQQMGDEVLAILEGVRGPLELSELRADEDDAASGVSSVEERAAA